LKKERKCKIQRLNRSARKKGRAMTFKGMTERNAGENKGGESGHGSI